MSLVLFIPLTSVKPKKFAVPQLSPPTSLRKIKLLPVTAVVVGVNLQTENPTSVTTAMVGEPFSRFINNDRNTKYDKPCTLIVVLEYQ